MKYFLLVLLIVILVLSAGACNEVENVSAENKGSVIGDNAFGIHVTVKNMTQEKVRFIVYPHADEWGYNGQGEVGKGEVFGTDGLVPGKKKGENVRLDGLFTIYANDKSGPSVPINVKGTYLVDDLKNDYSTMYFYIYKDGKFIKRDISNQSEVANFYNNDDGN